MYKRISVECDCCKKMVVTFYDRSEWWGVYLKDNEKQLCINCIKDRSDFRQEFRKRVGITVEETIKEQVEARRLD